MGNTVDIEVGRLTMRPDGILHAAIDFVKPPTKEMAVEYVTARTELAGPTPPPVILELVRVPYSEREVRSFLMESMPPPPCRAVVASDPTVLTIFRTYDLMAPQAVPTKLFSTVDAAVQWLHATWSGIGAGL